MVQQLTYPGIDKRRAGRFNGSTILPSSKTLLPAMVGTTKSKYVEQENDEDEEDPSERKLVIATSHEDATIREVLQ